MWREAGEQLGKGANEGEGRMKIAELRLFRVEGERSPHDWDERAVRSLDLYPEHDDVRADAWITSPHVSHIYLEVLTEEGASGQYGPIDARQAFLASTELRGLLIGADPLAGEQVHDKMLRLQRHGRAGLFVTALSAVDNALWDLRGKVAREPVYRLLGGPTRGRVPVYASMLGFSVEPERAAAAAQEYRARGFAAQKWFFRYGPAAGAEGMRCNLSLAESVRDAVGPGYRLMFDAVMGWDSTYAADMLRGLEGIDPSGSRSPFRRSGSRCSGGSRLARGCALPPASMRTPAGRSENCWTAAPSASCRRTRTGRAGSPSNDTSARCARPTTFRLWRTAIPSPRLCTSLPPSRRRRCRWSST